MSRLRDYEFISEVTSEFKVRGNQVSATFDVSVANLKWTEEEAAAFTKTVREKHSDLYAYRVRFEELIGDGEVLAPTTVDRLSFRWIGELGGPEPREKIEAEFAARRRAVQDMLSQWIVEVRA